MTRSEVARRLGKSVATVRKLEGVLLHPWEDARGTHRFDEAEVEALAEDVRSGRVALWRTLRGDTEPLDALQEEPCIRCAELESRIRDLREELVERDRSAQRELAALRAEWAAERARNARDSRELERELERFVAIVDSLAE